MAAGRNILLKIIGSPDDAQQAIRDIKRELRDLSKEQATAHVDVQIAAAERQLLGFRRQLQDLSRQAATPEVRLDTERVSRRILTLEGRLARLGAKRVEIDVDVRRGALETTIAGMRRLETTSNRVGSGIARSFRSVPLVGAFLSVAIDGVRALVSGLAALPALIAGIGQVFISAFQTGVETIRGLAQGTLSFGSVLTSAVGGLVSFGAAAGTAALSLVATAAAAALVVIAINAVLGAIIALTGALVALVASLTAAAAGLGALVVAFGAALAPAILVVIGLFTRFAAILKARKAHEQELAQAVEAQKTAEQRRRDALEASRQAHQRLSEATVEGNRAIRDSIFEVRDAQLSLETARNSVTDARLGVLDAKKALRELLTTAGVTGQALDHLFKQFSDVHVDPTKLQGLLGGVTAAGGDAAKVDPLALAHAIQNVRNAQQGVQNAVNQTAHAERTLSDATRRRTDFVKRGLDAYKPYRQALEQVRKADDRLTRAQEQSTAASRKYDRALKSLSPTEQGTLSRLNEIIKAFGRLAKTFTDPIFHAINDVFDQLRGKSGFLTSSLRLVGEAMADVIRNFGAFLAKPENRSAFQTMARGAASLARELGGKAFTSFLTIMREIALTALPHVISAARRLSGWLAHIAGQPGKIRSATDTVIEHFKTWAGFAWQVLRAVAGIFRAAAGPGRSLAGSLTTIVKKFADWANSREGQQRLRAFFARMVTRAKEIVRWIKDAAKWLKDHLPDAAAKAKDALNTVYAVLLAMKDVWKFMIDNPIANAVGIGEGASGGGRAARANVDEIAAKALSDKTPRQSRVDIALSLLALEISVKMRKELVKLLKQLGVTYQQARKLGYDGPKFGAGGTVTGAVGAPQMAMVHGGEEIIRASMAERFRPLLQAINAGVMPVVPQSAMASAAGGDVHHHYHVPTPAGGGNPDPRSTLEHIHRLITLKG